MATQQQLVFKELKEWLMSKSERSFTADLCARRGLDTATGFPGELYKKHQDSLKPQRIPASDALPHAGLSACPAGQDQVPGAWGPGSAQARGPRGQGSTPPGRWQRLVRIWRIGQPAKGPFQFPKNPARTRVIQLCLLPSR